MSMKELACYIVVLPCAAAAAHVAMGAAAAPTVTACRHRVALQNQQLVHYQLPPYLSAEKECK